MKPSIRASKVRHYFSRRQPPFLPPLSDSAVRRQLQLVWRRRPYLSPAIKLAIMSLIAFAWVALSLWLAQPWIADVTAQLGTPLTWFVIGGMALLPGCVNAFLISGLLFDRRPLFSLLDSLPPISVLIAAYNEEDCIGDTLDSLELQAYPENVEILVIDDGSTDATRQIVELAMQQPRAANCSLRLIAMPKNGGKSGALNSGLSQAAHELVVTVDADTQLLPHSLGNLARNHVRSSTNTAATAGTVLVGNARKNFITHLQEWDYFLGIDCQTRPVDASGDDGGSRRSLHLQ